jgi:HEAT repeat protein
VDALAALLADEKTSHIARYALERMPGDKAIEAMRDALPKVGGKLKPGLIGSLGVRRDETSVAAIAAFLGDSDKDVARAAAHALALIGTPAAADALSEFAKTAPADMKVPVADARLLCAEQLLADGARSEALALYKALNGSDQPTQVRVAAIKGMLAASTRK